MEFYKLPNNEHITNTEFDIAPSICLYILKNVGKLCSTAS